ncbi:hypothetical protein O181_012059 [Austropuccinia psidii MF-1]|uniref:Uncharacterized protein n=1 Tax=Austropuccinia psidii MF-1 TaxID=1389203 RepID=A0A9Q3GMH1_9BASI|nr:hypothetical protein [Austropuccinia psidii MF-1]
MVHTRNGRNYSFQPDGSGKGRAKTRARSGKSSSRKTCMEESGVAPNSPRSVLTSFDLNSEPELIQVNTLRAEPFPNDNHRNISVTVQKLVQRSQLRGVGNIPQPLAGGCELLLTHHELSGSGEDHRALRRMNPIVLQRQGQKDKEMVYEQKAFIHRPKEGVGNDPRFVKGRPSGVYQLQTSSRNVQRQVQRTTEKEERYQESSGKVQTKSQLEKTLPTRVQDPQIGTFRCGQCF